MKRVLVTLVAAAAAVLAPAAAHACAGKTCIALHLSGDCDGTGTDDCQCVDQSVAGIPVVHSCF